MTGEKAHALLTEIERWVSLGWTVTFSLDRESPGVILLVQAKEIEPSRLAYEAMVLRKHCPTVEEAVTRAMAHLERERLVDTPSQHVTKEAE